MHLINGFVKNRNVAYRPNKVWVLREITLCSCDAKLEENIELLLWVNWFISLFSRKIMVGVNNQHQTWENIS